MGNLYVTLLVYKKRGRMRVMEQFNHVTIIKKANTYFDGKVTSRTVLFEDGTKKTLGIMLPGEYEFSSNLKEEMDILDGHLEYKLQGEDCKVINGSGVFYVPANEKFQLKIYSVVDYCCSYITE
jgi:uncharacterized protein YaiE (UPF0345 family)